MTVHPPPELSFPSHPIAPARYDESLGAWVLTRYADVVAALHEPRLVGGGDVADAHAVVRDAARQGLSSERLADLSISLETSARALIAALPNSEPVDLASTFAEPWSLSIAMTVVGAPPDCESQLARLARAVFLSAATATDSEARPDALAAAADLARLLTSPADANAAAAVQTFTALAETLPRAICGAWLELMQHPDDAERLRAEPTLIARAVDELLRLSGPARAVFRRARSELEIGAARVEAGQRVVLMLSAANRDPERFAEPDRFDVHRDSSNHVAFGRGRHFCAGASLIRLAMAIATRAMLSGTTHVELAGQMEWLGGFAIRGPASLPTRLNFVIPSPSSLRSSRAGVARDL